MMCVKLTCQVRHNQPSTAGALHETRPRTGGTIPLSVNVDAILLAPTVDKFGHSSVGIDLLTGPARCRAIGGLAEVILTEGVLRVLSKVQVTTIGTTQ